MRVAEYGHVPIVARAAKLALHVAEDESRSIRRDKMDRRFSELPDQAKTRLQANLVAFIVAVASDQRTLEPAQGRDGERRNQVAGKEYQFAPRVIQTLNRQAQVGQMVVGVGKNSNKHGNQEA
jgi:hypothetical protein